ncbi:4'-phosphopantetheinyl transferase family protein [Fibrella forsythiae]|uniref:4'-phosphopantetheinyl transferase superfamily protein n=1 Tax=Fibrella forsythiae TaxID=2817061 RepID=A0ABS3JJS7_9BACT|nr:4'-phosphopantetheinyl transferase superfamily protein [Fibrella forsythiae]MBO0950261.1 4'-phosphopantetheinyl transferase superfamily protein [Fibrella forsythiae]
MPTLLIDTLPVVSWYQWPASLTPPDVAVFRYRLCAADQPWLYGLLHPDERERAERFRQLDDKQRFVAGRGWFRYVAGQLLGQSPQQVLLTTGPSGKPELIRTTGSQPGWHINVSHSGEWVLLAAGYVPVGVDVEWIKPGWPFQDLIESSFNADDQVQLAASQHPRELFYTLWTRKESLFKATGQGLTNDFMRISASKGVHQVKYGLPAGSGTWSILSFAVTDSYIGAVACQESPMPVRFFTLETASLGLPFSASDHQ